jgi:pimeloyl-ACP methyl ester carboxylesterase
VRRARYPDEADHVERDGVRVFYELYGDGFPTVLLLPTWSVAHSRAWKAQIPYLARHFRVVTLDGRGNGRSDRPPGVDPYAPEEFVADALVVLDATGTERAVAVGWSLGAAFGVHLAAKRPDRVLGLACIAPLVATVRPRTRAIPLTMFNLALPVHPGWTKYNRRYMRTHQREFLEWFVRVNCSDAHSTRQIEDQIAWGMDTDGDTLSRTAAGFVGLSTLIRLHRDTRRLSCPVLVIHGTGDRNQPHRDGREFARRTGARLVSIDAGHAVAARKPVQVNLALREFVRSLAAAREPDHARV